MFCFEKSLGNMENMQNGNTFIMNFKDYGLNIQDQFITTDIRLAGTTVQPKFFSKGRWDRGMSTIFLGPYQIFSQFRDIRKELDDDCLTFKDVERSLDRTVSDILSSRSEEDFRMASKSLQDFGILQKNLDLCTPESTTGIDRHWGQDSNLTPQCAKSFRTQSGLPVRRSLVGSFEESLMSGRLSSGKISQRIDGFLAVLMSLEENFHRNPKNSRLQ
ncbi:hypothetical protein L1049_028469 [Liquidambar formosana]|uniref:Uncharacterized protein n=1 Tax=Liquidambar formosana TaxID=63359 RepID=A0AAP0WWK8_LIQFO